MIKVLVDAGAYRCWNNILFCIEKAGIEMHIKHFFNQMSCYE